MSAGSNGHNVGLAVLIDADNANPAIVEGLLAEVAKFGVASVKRIYGDWTTPALGKWKAALLEHSIQPIQQFAYTSGKNATDSAMIIDAMDLLYTGEFGGFCIVSSDSDFTRLASRLRESGKVVYGFGERKTPKPFVAACDRFIYTEIFTSNPETEEATIKRKSAQELRQDTKLCHQLRQAIEAASDDEGWANLGPVGSQLAKQMPEFDPRNYGYSKFSGLLEGIGLFTIKRENNQLLIKDQRPGKKA
ncbi:NYN domain-containing protein [Halopseudomonas phragmitis]|uniref:Maebl n=1 Tax=Halopseudomonas phragmitis TaxID=1931241 RepID=A0A1V0B1J8_9GAMM|nr:NYN domain-containing protein [Halopseudomonas phragmitis]AQZ93806.1 Maebl [Halopseudomonas phragmitis]